MKRAQSYEDVNRIEGGTVRAEPDAGRLLELASCKRVLTTHIGFVAVEVAIPMQIVCVLFQEGQLLVLAHQLRPRRIDGQTSFLHHD